MGEHRGRIYTRKYVRTFSYDSHLGFLNKKAGDALWGGGRHDEAAQGQGGGTEGADYTPSHTPSPLRATPAEGSLSAEGVP